MALTHHWPLDDNAASTVVSADTGSDATLAGGDNTSVKQTSSGPGGSIAWAFDLNGSDDYVAYSSVNRGGAFSLSCWVNLDSTSDQYLFGRAGSVFRNLRIISSTSIEFTTNLHDPGDNTFTIPTLSTGTWYHVFLTRTSGGSARFWINGTESSSGAQSVGGDFTTDAIGNSGGSYLNGRISQVRFWDSDESASVATWYAEGVSAGGGGGRTTKNTRSHPLGVNIGMNWRVTA